MTVPFLDLKAQYVGIASDVQQAIQRVLDSQHFILGPEVQSLEEEVAHYVGARHGVGVASGTDALLLALKAMAPESGGDVIVPAFTFFATAGAVWNAGLKPVFCDVDPGTFNVTAETLEAAWTESTVGVVPVHMFGQISEMGDINSLAGSRRAFVLEDAAQAIGAEVPDGKAGSLADAAAFSFFPTKNLGGYGDGGLVTTDSSDLADRIRKLRVHGGKKMYHHEMVGTNSRLDALQAAILRAKLPYLDGYAAKRRENAAVYLSQLVDVDGVELPTIQADHVHVFNQFTLKVRDRDALREHLSGKGIGSAVYYPVPLHLQRCFVELGYVEGDLPVSEALCGSVVSLPIFPELGVARAEKVAEEIRAFYA